MDFVRIMWVLLEIVFFVLHIVALIVLIWALGRWIYSDIKDAPPAKTSRKNSSTSVPPQHRRETNRSGVSIGVNGETYTRDNQGRAYDSNGNYVKTHTGFDGNEYVGDKYTPRLYDHPDDRLW